MNKAAVKNDEYEQAPIDSDALKKLSNLALLQAQREKEVEEAEERLRKANQLLNEVAEKDIPELMKSLKLESIKTDSGLTIVVKDTLHCSVAGERGPKACAWLDENGYGDLVKRECVISFKRDEEGWFNKFMADLRKRKKQLRVEEKRTVHNATLTTFIKEQLEEGEDIPLELFGAYWRRRSKIT